MTTAQPCKGCGAPIDCDTGDDFAYSLTADPTLPFFFICPPPYTCLPAPGPGGQVTSSEIFLDCCGHHLTATIFSNSTPEEVSAITLDLVNRCIQVSGECANPPVSPNTPPNQTNPVTVYYNNPTRCVVYCPDGTPFNYTLPAGATFGSSQLDADNAASRLCVSRANANRLCLGDLPQVGCLGTEAFEELVATSSNLPVTFSITSGTIPTGTAFSPIDPSTAVLSGTLNTPGIYTFTVSATDSIGQTVTKSYTINVFGITNATLPDGFVGNPYSQQLLTIGGTGAVAFSVAPNTLPDGLSISVSGLITGTPTITGVTGFDVTFTDSDGKTCTQTVTIEIENFDCITNSHTLPDGTVGVAYSQALASTFGTGPRTFTTSDALPAGLTLHSDGTIDGTPTTPGTTSFDVTVTDSLSNHCNDLCTIKVTACPDWTTLAWGTAVENNGSFTPSNSTSDSFVCSENAGVSQSFNTGTMLYNGTGCNCAIDITTDIALPGPACAVSVYVQSPYTPLLCFSTNVGGSFHSTFSLPNTGGSTYTIKVLVSPPPSVGPMTLSGTISNV